MECHTMGSVSPGSYGVEKHITWLLCPTVKLNSKNVHKFQCNTRMGPQRLSLSYQAYRGKHFMRHTCWRTFCTPVTLEEELLSRQSENHSNDDDFSAEVSAKEEVIVQPLNSLELKTLIADSERAKLMKKLSEANQQNRFLKRQLYAKEDALVNFKSDLAVMELEIQALVTLADEIAKSAIPVGSRKINGKYIQSHLSTRLEAVREKLKEQIEDVEAARSKEVPIFWRGMAESVQIMGSFDGWSQGEHLSPEYTGSFTKFSTTLILRPGRYEIKFLVDEEWQLSSDFPTVGEGLTENNLLIVE